MVDFIKTEMLKMENTYVRYKDDTKMNFFEEN